MARERRCDAGREKAQKRPMTLDTGARLLTKQEQIAVLGFFYPRCDRAHPIMPRLEPKTR